MTSEITSALIAAFVSIITSAIAFYIALKNLGSERDRILVDKKRLEADLLASKLQAKIWEAEFPKLKAETEKILAEANEIKQKKIQIEREEIEQFIKLFERAAFSTSHAGGEPTAVFDALQKTRIELQIGGASFIHNREIADKFRELQTKLYLAELEVLRRYPKIVDALNMVRDYHPNSAEREKIVLEFMSVEECMKATALLRSRSSEYKQMIDEVRNSLYKLQKTY